MNSLEEKVLVLTEKVDKLSSLVGQQEQYSRRNCILMQDLKENQNEDTDEVPYRPKKLRPKFLSTLNFRRPKFL